MPIRNPIAIEFLVRGSSVDKFAKENGFTPASVNQVTNAHSKSRSIEKALIKEGMGEKLAKQQRQKGIFNQERYDQLLEETKQEAASNG